VPVQMDIAGVGTIKGNCTFHFGRRAVVAVACYARERDFEAQQEAFRSVNDSFQFDQTFAYIHPVRIPTSRPARVSKGILDDLGPAAMPAMWCGIIAVLAMMFAFAYNIRKPRVGPAPAPLLPLEQKPPGTPGI